MGFFISPTKLIDIIRNKEKINDCELFSSEWFTSTDGHNAYKNADTLFKKVSFYYEYLLSVALDKKNTEALWKIAFIMADSIENSSLEFGRYPDILNPKKNPLVAYTVYEVMANNSAGDDFGAIDASQLLCALHKEKFPNNYIYSCRKPYSRLTNIKSDSMTSDLYKVEREIIWAFCVNTSDKLDIGPFTYSICEKEDDDSKDEVEGFFALEEN